jgi:5-methylcytosine-specific restriction endonuclease McrA
VLELLQEHELDLSTVAHIASALTPENCPEILERVRGRSYREVERVMCEYRPPVALHDRIRPMRVALPEPGNVDAILLEREFAESGYYPTTPGAGSWIDSEEKFFVQFLASEALIAKFEKAKTLLSNRKPGASVAEVLAVVLGEFIERRSPAARQRRRDARREKNHSRRREWNAASRRTRHIAAEVRDEVLVRDQGECSYVAPDGTRCRSKNAVQIDHIRPWAVGGGNESSNLRLLCAAHNRLAAEHTLGAHVMSHHWRQE